MKRRAVILRHDLPDLSWHWDLLLEPDSPPGGPDERVLLAFRIDPAQTPPHRPGAQRFEALALPHHRRLYLDHEGPIGGGRGTVRREARGVIAWVTQDEGGLTLDADWGAGPARWSARPRDATLWAWERCAP